MKNKILILIIISASFGCSKKEANPEINGIKIGDNQLIAPDKTTMTNVEIKPNTAEVPIETMINAFQSFDKNTGQLTFKSSAAELKDLKTGSVVQFSGYDIRKIQSVTESGGKIIVKTTAAKFIDYYKSAKIDYATKFNWSNSTIASANIGVQDNGESFRLKYTEANAYANATSAYTFEGKLKGFDIKLKLTPQTTGNDRRLDINLLAKKGNLAGIEFTGFLSNFDITSNIEVENSRATAYSEQHENVNGELDVKMAFVSTGSEDAAFEIPMDFYEVMLLTGGIPVTYRIKLNLKIYPQIAANSSSEANVKLKYSANNGFSYSNQSMLPRATLSSYTPSLSGNTGSASTGIVGVGVGLEFPRFEIGIFNTVVVPYMLINSSVVNYFESGLPYVPGPCNRTRLSIKAVAGLDLNFLGNTFQRDITLYEQTKSFKKEGSKCPD